MDILYWMTGTGIGVLLLLLYTKSLIQKNSQLKTENDKLISHTNYQNAVIKQLSTPRTVDTTINSLHEGVF